MTAFCILSFYVCFFTPMKKWVVVASFPSETLRVTHICSCNVDKCITQGKNIAHATIFYYSTTWAATCCLWRIYPQFWRVDAFVQRACHGWRLTPITMQQKTSPQITMQHIPSPQITMQHIPSPQITMQHIPSPQITMQHILSPQITMQHIPSPQITIQDSRLIYYLIREIKTWLNINHITVHNNTYFIF